MFEHVVKFLHHKDKSVLMSLAYSNKENTDLAVYVANHESDLRSAMKIDDNLYIEKNTSTTLKMSILRRIFALYDADPMDLVFYLKDLETKKSSDVGRCEIRRRYWEYALPIIQKQHFLRGTFSGCNPTASNTESGYFGISGFCISCVANYDNARVDFYLGNGDIKKNKDTFDMFYQHKNEIESRLGISLDWDRSDNSTASVMSYHLDGVSITNEADWPRMAKFHAEWSDKICGVMLEYLLSDEEKRHNAIASILKEWVQTKENTHLDAVKCNKTYTRFTTDGMTAILPDIPDAPSGWNTDNHYFYEIINRNGKTTYIQLSISSKNISDKYHNRGFIYSTGFDVKLAVDSLAGIITDTDGLKLNLKGIDTDSLFVRGRYNILLDSCQIHSLDIQGNRLEFRARNSIIENFYLNLDGVWKWTFENTEVGTEYLSGSDRHSNNLQKGECKRVVWTPLTGDARLQVNVREKAAITITPE